MRKTYFTQPLILWSDEWNSVPFVSLIGR